MQHRIRVLRYLCDGSAGVGPCTVDSGRFHHIFQRNAPVFDTVTQQILGCVDVRASGVNDSAFSRDFSAQRSPSRRLGKMDRLELEGAPDALFLSHGLYTDSAGKHLFLVQENPADNYHGIPTMANPTKLDEAIGIAETTAVFFYREGCAGCEKMAPAALRLGSHVRLLAYSGLTNESDAVRRGISKFPQIILYRKGKKISTVSDPRRVAARLDACRLKVLKA